MRTTNKKTTNKSFKLLGILLAILCVAMMTACGSAAAKEITVSDVEGTWLYTTSDGVQTYTFNSDMTYHIKTEILTPPPVMMERDDTYTLEGNTIGINYSEWNTVSEYKVTIKDGVMTWDSGEGTMEFKKQ